MNRKAVSHLRRVDPVMAGIIERVGPCRFRVSDGGTHFDAITRSIVYQQLSGSAAATIHSRLTALYDGAAPEPALLLATSDDALRGAGSRVRRSPI